MTDTIKLVRNDTRPSLVVTLTDSESASPIDITGATLALKFRKQGETTSESIPGIVLDGPEGLCKFNWTVDALSGEAGLYEGEIEITFSDATIQTVFDRLRFRLREDF
jgi:hypothetical protein